MVFIKYGNHTIEVRLGPGQEENIFYDGQVVSSKMGRGMKSDHSFQVKEDNENATYEVKLATKGMFMPIPGRVRVKIEAFRNGKKFYSSE